MTVDGVVTVVDAAALSEGRFAADEGAIDRQRSADAMLDHTTPLGELFKDQLVAADLWWSTRPTSSTPTGSARSSAIAAEMRPGTGLIRAANGHVDIAALLGLGLAGEDHLAGRDSAHELEHGGEAMKWTISTRFRSRLDGVPDQARLLAESRRRSGRMTCCGSRALPPLPGSDARLAIQAVGPRVNAWFDRPWAGREARQRRWW